MSIPKVSIITCCFNGEKYIPISFSSILEQTYDNIEFIFVDDGSIDSSLEVATSFKEKFEQRGYEIKIISQKNQGPGYAAINGIKYATGDYLSYLDVDDSLLPKSVEMRANALIQNPSINIVRTNGWNIFEGTEPLKQTILITDDKDKKSKNLFEDIIIGVANNFAGTFMIRSSALKQFYGDREIPYSDFGQNLQLILPGAYNSESIFIDEPLMNYIIHSGSHSHPKTLEEQIRMLQGYCNLRLTLIKFCKEENPELERKAKVFALRLILDAILVHSEHKQQLNLFNNYYSELKRLNGITFEHRFQKAQIKNSVLRFPLRGLLKVIKLLHL